MIDRDDIIRAGVESGLLEPGRPIGERVAGELERFAALVSAAEREACADILDRNADRCDPYSIAFDVLDSNAKAIRARGAP